MPYSLPRRRRNVFHLNNDQDLSSKSDAPPLKLKTRLISFLGPPAAVAAVPFQRTNSSPILLSNGKPLKSSLKGSPSMPSMPPSPTDERGAGPTGRTRASSTPALDHHAPKNVHFPSNSLATVCFYSRSARPASLSLADGGDTKTETETERTEGSLRTKGPLRPEGSLRTEGPLRPLRTKGPLQPLHPCPLRPLLPLQPPLHSLDTALSSPVPAPAPSAHANVHLESLTLDTPLALKGTLLVRNLAYEKTVAVCFTLDNWVTTSEVLAHYTASLPALPPALYVPGAGLQAGLQLPDGPAPHPGDTPAWDRFAFTIRLDHYAPSLATRTLWLVVRYCTLTAATAPGEGLAMRLDDGDAGDNEWWDNNGGRNYKVVFRLTEAAWPTPPPPPPVATPPPSPSPLSSPTAQYSRLRSLSLSNYAAPVPPSPTSSSNHDHDSHPSPASTTSDASPSLPTPVDIGIAMGTMQFVNGFPATGPSGLGFGLALDTGPSPPEKREETPDAAVSLYWPWGRRPEREHKRAVPALSLASNLTSTHHGGGHASRMRGSSSSPPPLVDSSSGSSEEGAGERRRARVGRRVFGPLVSSGGVDASEGMEERERIESERAYEAIVRKWCFAGPQRPQIQSSQHHHQQEGRGARRPGGMHQHQGMVY